MTPENFPNNALTSPEQKNQSEQLLQNPQNSSEKQTLSPELVASLLQEVQNLKAEIAELKDGQKSEVEQQASSLAAKQVLQNQLQLTPSAAEVQGQTSREKAEYRAKVKENFRGFWAQTKSLGSQALNWVKTNYTQANDRFVGAQESAKTKFSEAAGQTKDRAVQNYTQAKDFVAQNAAKIQSGYTQANAQFEQAQQDLAARAKQKINETKTSAQETYAKASQQVTQTGENLVNDYNRANDRFEQMQRDTVNAAGEKFRQVQSRVQETMDQKSWEKEQGLSQTIRTLETALDRRQELQEELTEVSRQLEAINTRQADASKQVETQVKALGAKQEAIKELTARPVSREYPSGQKQAQLNQLLQEETGLTQDLTLLRQQSLTYVTQQDGLIEAQRELQDELRQPDLGEAVIRAQLLADKMSSRNEEKFGIEGVGNKKLETLLARAEELLTTSETSAKDFAAPTKEERLTTVLPDETPQDAIDVAAEAVDEDAEKEPAREPIRGEFLKEGEKLTLQEKDSFKLDLRKNQVLEINAGTEDGEPLSLETDEKGNLNLKNLATEENEEKFKAVKTSTLDGRVVQTYRIQAVPGAPKLHLTVLEGKPLKLEVIDPGAGAQALNVEIKTA